MKKSLLTYSTVDGQTELICRKIAGYYNVEDIDILPISPSINLNNYKAVVIGASIRYGKYRNEIYLAFRNQETNLRFLPYKVCCWL